LCKRKATHFFAAAVESVAKEGFPKRSEKNTIELSFFLFLRRRPAARAQMASL
jgi:hypothetical protein